MRYIRTRYPIVLVSYGYKLAIRTKKKNRYPLKKLQPFSEYFFKNFFDFSCVRRKRNPRKSIQNYKTKKTTRNSGIFRCFGIESSPSPTYRENLYQGFPFPDCFLSIISLPVVSRTLLALSRGRSSSCDNDKTLVFPPENTRKQNEKTLSVKHKSCNLKSIDVDDRQV